MFAVIHTGPGLSSVCDAAAPAAAAAAASAAAGEKEKPGVFASIARFFGGSKSPSPADKQEMAISHVTFDANHESEVQATQVRRVSPAVLWSQASSEATGQHTRNYLPKDRFRTVQNNCF
jgi:hypothetical protein